MSVYQHIDLLLSSDLEIEVLILLCSIGSECGSQVFDLGMKSSKALLSNSSGTSTVTELGLLVLILSSEFVQSLCQRSDLYLDLVDSSGGSCHCGLMSGNRSDDNSDL